MMKSSELILICLISNSLCCGQKKPLYSKDCIEYNNLAVQELDQYLKYRNEIKYLVNSLGWYDKAIDCDSLNEINYQGKLTVLNLLMRYDESLKVLDRLFILSGKTDAQIIVSKGLIYERLGKTDSSDLMHKQAFHVYDQRLSRKSSDSMAVICGKIYLIAITQGKQPAIKILEQYQKTYPNNQTLKTYSIVIRDFNKDALLFR